jgi:hypothetical protein
MDNRDDSETDADDSRTEETVISPPTAPLLPGDTATKIYTTFALTFTGRNWKDFVIVFRWVYLVGRLSDADRLYMTTSHPCLSMSPRVLTDNTVFTNTPLSTSFFLTTPLNMYPRGCSGDISLRASEERRHDRICIMTLKAGDNSRQKWVEPELEVDTTQRDQGRRFEGRQVHISMCRDSLEMPWTHLHAELRGIQRRAHRRPRMREVSCRPCARVSEMRVKSYRSEQGMHEGSQRECQVRPIGASETCPRAASEMPGKSYQNERRMHEGGQGDAR